MPTAYTPSATDRLAALEFPNNGESASVASVLDKGLKYLADTAKFIRDKVPGAAASYVVPISLGAPHRNGNSRFLADVGAGDRWIQIDITDRGSLDFPMHLPVASGTLTAVTLYVTGSLSGTPRSAPQNKPSFYLNSSDWVAGTDADSAEATDAETIPGDYDVPHTIELTGLSIALSSTSDHFLCIEGESGTGAAGNEFAIYGATATITP